MYFYILERELTGLADGTDVDVREKKREIQIKS